MVKIEQQARPAQRVAAVLPSAGRPRLLVISHVLPFPGNSGQQQRIAYTLKAARAAFEVHFLTYAEGSRMEATRNRLREFCDEAIVLESVGQDGIWNKAFHKFVASSYAAFTGLKKSNYQIGRVELTRRRLRAKLSPKKYDCVLYEYTHAAESASLFREVGVPTIVDTHNILWRARESDLRQEKRTPEWLKQRWLRQYRQTEEAAWLEFDGAIAINRTEFNYLQDRLPASKRSFYAPMGIDLARWPCCWQPATPPRVAYYGGLGSPHNQAAALRCHERIMPEIWKRFPSAELWLVGSNPSDRLQRLTCDPRVKVTGFVENVQDILSTMSVVLCPWSGTYGFRSRLVEVMALGVPVIATPEAVDGMELESGRGILLANSDDALAGTAMELLSAPNQLSAQSRLARAEMERLYSLENTYDQLMMELREWLETRNKKSLAG